MEGFKGYKLEFKLEPQSPMLHFQNSQRGATLRASEAKPKLDRFLLKKYPELRGHNTGNSALYIEEGREALDYKMRITVYRDSRGYSLTEEKPDRDGKMKARRLHSVYYGDLKAALFSYPKVTVICFHDKLRKMIEESVEDFFNCTNFGAMQGKGFGGFVVEGFLRRPVLTPQEERAVARALLNETGARRCYHMKFDKRRDENLQDYYEKMFREIKTFYGVMKSGQNFSGYARSFLFQYMHARKIDNEKAWMKKNKIAPCAARNGNETRGDFSVANPRYVRAVLGLAGSMSYLKDTINKRNKVIIKIESEKEGNNGFKFERADSPIFFKIVKNEVFIAAFRVPEELFDQKFFFSRENPEIKKELRTPRKEEFDIDDFLHQYVAYYNGNLRGEIKMKFGKESYKKVEEITV